VLKQKYTEGLLDLDSFRYIYVIYYIDRVRHRLSMTASPPWTPGTKVGLFASRSSVRPNPIGISIVRIKKKVNNEIFTSGLDVFDNTPLVFDVLRLAVSDGEIHAKEIPVIQEILSLFGYTKDEVNDLISVAKAELYKLHKIAS